MGTSIIHTLVVIFSCCVVVYKPSNGFEFFRNLTILGASMGYDFWSTYSQLGDNDAKLELRKLTNFLGLVFFVAVFFDWVVRTV